MVKFLLLALGKESQVLLRERFSIEECETIRTVYNGCFRILKESRI